MFDLVDPLLGALISDLQRKVAELEARIQKLESARITEAEDTYKKGSGRYL